jgi:hypothetical protein
MSTRRELLASIFHQFEARGLSWCVLRNHETLFVESASDVDLLTTPQQAAVLLDTCRKVAETSGYRLVQQARFVNHTLVFWNQADRWVRIDVDTELRWRRHHLLTAAEILAARRSRENFYIPAAAHEAVIILTQALWQGKVSDRYQRRLQELQGELSENPRAWADGQVAFGEPVQPLNQLGNPKLVKLARAVRANFWRRPENAFRSLGYWGSDAGRYFSRWQNPPGLFMRWYGGDPRNARRLIEILAMLFPANKSAVSEGVMNSAKRREVLFVGGLAIECLPAPAAGGGQSWPNRARSFSIMPQGSQQWRCCHVGSGATGAGADPANVAAFICSSLAQSLQSAAGSVRSSRS